MSFFRSTFLLLTFFDNLIFWNSFILQIPNNQSGLASTSLAERHLPLDNYKNNILKAKSQDENKKVGGQAMLSFPAVLPTSSSSAVASIDDKSRYDCLYFSLSYSQVTSLNSKFATWIKSWFEFPAILITYVVEVLLKLYSNVTYL